MKITYQHELPDELKPVLKKGIVLECVTIAFMLSVIVLVYFVMGSSQAMRTAWVEDILTLVPPSAFLISNRLRNRAPSEEFPYGFHSAILLAFFTASLALTVFGLLLLADSVMTLIRAEHPTIGSMKIFGHLIWQGWLMIAVMVYSAIGPVVLGYMKITVAQKLHDKTLYTDASMNKADWMTAVAAIAGILGLGYGWWWADSAAAAAISTDIIHDGFKHMKAVLGDMLNRTPRRVDKDEKLPLLGEMIDKLKSMPWVRDADVRLRENGHVFFGEIYIVPADTGRITENVKNTLQELYAMDWRLLDLVVEVVEDVHQRIPRNDKDD